MSFAFALRSLRLVSGFFRMFVIISVLYFTAVRLQVLYLLLETSKSKNTLDGEGKFHPNTAILLSNVV